MTLTAKKTGDFVSNNNNVVLIYIHNADNLFKDAIYTVKVGDKSIDTVIEKSSNRLMLDLNEAALDLSKLDEAGLVFDIKKWVK